MAPPSLAFTTPYLKGGLRVVASKVSSSYKALGFVLDLEQAGEASTNHASEFVDLYCAAEMLSEQPHHWCQRALRPSR